MFCTQTIGGDRPRLHDLLGGHVADSEIPDEAFLLQLDECFHSLGDRTRLRPLGVAHAHVDEVERLDAEGEKVLVHLLTQILGPARCRPSPPSASRLAPTLVAMNSDSG